MRNWELKTIAVLISIGVIAVIVTAIQTDGFSGGSKYNYPASNTTTATITGLTNEEELYKDKIQQNASIISNSMLNFGDLSQSSDIYTESWIYSVAAELVTIQWAYEDLLTISTPSSMLAAHNKYVQGVSHII